MTAAWGLTRLGLKLTRDPRISLLLVAIWAVAPGSVALSMTYAEALFCALAIWALFALASGRWLTAGLLTLAAGTVRSTASGVPTSSARPPSTRSPVPAAITANFTDELPELRTSTEPPEAAMARMLPGPDESVMPGTVGSDAVGSATKRCIRSLSGRSTQL